MPPGGHDPAIRSNHPPGVLQADRESTGTPRDRSVIEGRLQHAVELASGIMPGDAVRPYRELLELEPEHVEGRLQFARLLDRLEEAGDAVEVLSDGLRRSPDQTEFLVLRGAILGRLQRYREAEVDLRRVLRLHPSHAPA
jgi:tetratricopeptide (TPR) repeat protein